MKRITFDSFVRTCALLLAVVLAVMTIDYLSVVLVPFFVAWFVAYLIFPLVEFFQYKMRFRFRIPSILLSLSLIGGIITAIVLLCMPTVVAEFHRFVSIVDNHISRRTYNNDMELLLADYIQHINFKELIHSGQFIDITKVAIGGVWSVMQSTVGFVASIVSWSMSVLYLFFILYDYERINRSLRRLVPRKYSHFANNLLTDLKIGMNAYFRGQFLIALCVGALFCIGFEIINFPLAIPMGILVGVLSFIPYLHALALVPAFLLCILKSAETGQNFWLVLLSAAAVFVIVQIIQDAVLTPRIMGKAIGLPPYLILLSLSVWGCLLGVIGMIIALPLTTLICSYYKRYINRS
ncbi:MAG: AI-2E family transporter [Prevotellaceae bacterium]|nr:AI-2E family transporter [Prevotellaceae bacterium]